MSDSGTFDDGDRQPPAPADEGFFHVEQPGQSAGPSSPLTEDGQDEDPAVVESDGTLLHGVTYALVPRPEPRNLGDIVREERVRRSYSQERLAQLAQLSPAYISFIENGKTKKPSRDTIIAIAQALRVEPIDMLEAAGQATPNDKLAAGRLSFHEFVDSDYRLRSDQKKLLKDLYESWIGRSGSPSS